MCFDKLRDINKFDNDYMRSSNVVCEKGYTFNVHITQRKMILNYICVLCQKYVIT